MRPTASVYPYLNLGALGNILGFEALNLFLEVPCSYLEKQKTTTSANPTIVNTTWVQLLPPHKSWVVKRACSRIWQEELKEGDMLATGSWSFWCLEWNLCRNTVVNGEKSRHLSAVGRGWINDRGGLIPGKSQRLGLGGLHWGSIRERTTGWNDIYHMWPIFIYVGLKFVE